MKSFAWSCAVVASCALLATAWVWGASSGGDDGRAVPPRARAGAGAQPSVTIQNLSDGDRAIFFHMSEGIELVPLPWIKVLKSIKTNRPFLQIPERFGLIEDPADPDHLPIGITASTSRGGDLFGRMVGVNCAACHVGAVTRGTATLPLLGAPNLFDLNAFYQELFGSLGVMLVDEATRLQFIRDLAAQDPVQAILAQQLLAAAAVASQLDGASMKDAARLFQARLIQVVQEAVAKAEAEARQAGHPPDAAAIAALTKAVMKKVGSLYEKDTLGLVALVLSGDAPDDPVAAAIKASPDPLLTGILKELQVGLSLLRARVRFIASLKALHAAQRPLPGPGRIDAFDGIRDLVFPPSDGIAADSPVSYPELWLVNQTYWLHWDGNTNSLIERNIGQALGQGAPFEAVGQGDYHSLVQPANIAELEITVRKLAPPEWPVPLFGPIDPARAARGQAIYQDRCVGCHRPAGLGRPAARPARAQSPPPPHAAREGHPRGRDRHRPRACHELRHQRRPAEAAIHRRDRLRRGAGRCGVAIQPEGLHG
jgi:mono/diheme cytochrome c family protein